MKGSNEKWVQYSSQEWHLGASSIIKVSKIIRNKWVYCTKLKSGKTLDKYRARVVAKGFQQIAGLDYKETFSPIFKPTIIIIVLAIVIFENWPLDN